VAQARIAAPSGEELQAESGPKFFEKLEDIVGLYMNPPHKALVLSVDEKSQIRALERNPADFRHDSGGTLPTEVNQGLCDFIAAAALEVCA
jgi:hypothetical protein